MIKLSKNIPVAGIVTILLLIITEIFIRHHSENILQFQNEKILILKREIINGPKLNYNGLIIGDCRLLILNAKKMSEIIDKDLETDIEIYNFSTAHIGPYSAYLILKKYIEKHKTPRFVIYGSSPYMLTNLSDWFLRPYRFALFFGLRDAVQVLPYRGVKAILQKKIEEQFKLIWYRKEIQIFLSKKNRLYPKTLDYKVIKENNGGIVVVPTEPLTDKEIKKSTYYRFQPPFKERNVVWLKRFLSLAKEHNVQVFILTTPQLPLIKEKRETTGFNQKYKIIISKLVKEFPNVILLDPIGSQYARDQFATEDQLNPKGADLLANEICAEIIKYYSTEKQRE